MLLKRYNINHEFDFGYCIQFKKYLLKDFGVQDYKIHCGRSYLLHAPVLTQITYKIAKTHDVGNMNKDLY